MMEPLQFVYWLQGFLELSDVKKLNEKQLQILKDHIALVLEKRTPNYEKASPPKIDPLRWIDPNIRWDAQPNVTGTSVVPIPEPPQTLQFLPQFTTADEVKRAQFDGVPARDVPLCASWPNGTIASC